MRPSALSSLVLLLCLVSPTRLLAQEPVPSPALAQRVPAAFSVFFDLSFLHVDFDHVRREITFVNWVRDQADANLHILGTSQTTGGGGTEYTFTLIGRRAIEGRLDTLRYVSGNTDTSTEIRDGITQLLKLTLLRYVAESPVAQRVQVSYQPAQEQEPAGPVEDPWNLWVFRIGANGFFSGESNYNSGSYSGSVSANRVTESLKTSFYASSDYSRSEYSITDTTSYVNSSRDFSTRFQSVWSLGPHWSVGGRLSASRSTYLNRRLTGEAGLALEFNVFPYAESSRRQFTFLYTLGSAHYEYEEITIFGKSKETIGRHSFTISGDFQQAWGSLDISLSSSQYLHDSALYNLGLFVSTNVRIFRGLSLNLFASTSRIRDQIYLSGAGLNQQDILTQRRRLQTDHDFFASVGFSYSFGSKSNNVVNTRIW